MISMEKGLLTLSGGIDTVTEEDWSWDVPVLNDEISL